jgi:hypothetical protein
MHLSINKKSSAVADMVAVSSHNVDDVYRAENVAMPTVTSILKAIML